MKKLLYIVFLLLPVLLRAQSESQIIIAQSSDDVLKIRNTEWRYINTDDTAMAGRYYNDSNWASIHPHKKGDTCISMLKGVSWLRKHVYVPDSIKKLPLAINIVHLGASELYLDGKLLQKFGKISADKDSVVYYNPAMEPVMFHFDDTGWHTFAIRYVNHRTEPQQNNENYIHGFVMSIGEANETFASLTMLRAILFGFLLGVAGIFTALAGLHLLLWLFRTSDKSNIFLSILCTIFCIYFVMYSFWSVTTDADVFIHRTTTTSVLFMIALMTLSALLNYLFARIYIRFWTIAALCILSVILTINAVSHHETIASLVMLLVMAEAVVLIIGAIRRKVKGARILAIGILPLAVSSVAMFLLQLAVSSSDIASAGKTGTASVFLIFLALFSFFILLSFSAIPLSMSVFLAWRFASVSKDLSTQLAQVKELSEKTQEQEAEKKRILENQKAELEREVAERTSEIIEEKKKSDDLLYNILPHEVASELKERGATTAHHFDQVTVLFTDFVDFTLAGERMGSQALVEELHSCFKVFDDIMSKYGIEKIKTIGDAYMAVCGLPRADEQHAEKVVAAAMEIRSFIQERRQQLGDKTFEIRIGIHSGEVVAGIVGVKKFAYDIWGDTVNTAARMEQNSEPGKINISQTTYDLVKQSFKCTYRGEFDAKNKGKLKMYFVD